MFFIAYIVACFILALRVNNLLHKKEKNSTQTLFASMFSALLDAFDSTMK